MDDGNTISDLLNSGKNIEDKLKAALENYNKKLSELMEDKNKIEQIIKDELDLNKDNIKQGLENTKDKLSGLTDTSDTIKDKANEIKDKVEEKAKETFNNDGSNTGSNNNLFASIPFVPLFTKNDDGGSNTKPSTTASQSNNGNDTSSLLNSSLINTIKNHVAGSNSRINLGSTNTNEIYFDFNKTNTTAQKLSDCYLSLNRDINELKEIIQDITLFWSGSGQIDFSSKFEECLNLMKVYNEFVQDGSDQLNNAIKSYQKLDEAFTENSI